MEFLRAFTYVFDDRHWVIKLGKMALLVALMPVPVIGLFCLCALLGYLAEIIHNVSYDYPRPLPEWDHIGEDISKGAHVLLAIIVYHLPPLIVIGLLYISRDALAVSVFGSITFLGVLTAILPFLLLYLVFAWALLAIGLAYYADTWEADAFYRLNRSLRSVQRHGALAVQWLISSLAASIIMLLIPPLALFLFFPVHGYLAGAYARRLRAARIQLRDAHTAAAARVNALRFAAPESQAPLRRNRSV